LDPTSKHAFSCGVHSILYQFHHTKIITWMDHESSLHGRFGHLGGWPESSHEK